MDKQSNFSKDIPTNKEYWVELNEIRKKLGLPEFYICEVTSIVWVDDYHGIKLTEES